MKIHSISSMKIVDEVFSFKITETMGKPFTPHAALVTLIGILWLSILICLDSATKCLVNIVAW